MQLTPNYNLKKPEETDPIDILDLNDNADIIDAEFKKRPVASGGDVSEMTVKTLETTTTEFPVPVAGESTKTFLGKVKKFFEDTKNWMTGVCLIGQIVNNCVTNNAKLPLSAAQGKVLMDLYTVLNTNKIKFLYINSKLSTSSNNYGVSTYTPDLSLCNNVLAAICIGVTPEGQFSTANFWVSYVDQKTGQISIVNYTGMTKRFIVSELIIYTD